MKGLQAPDISFIARRAIFFLKNLSYMKRISTLVAKSCRFAASPALGPRPPNRKRQVERMDGRPACVFAAMLIMAIVPRVM